MSDEGVEITDPPPSIDLHELALEWAACRRALTTICELTDDERDEFALLASIHLLGKETR